MTESMPSLLRSLPSLQGSAPEIELSGLPADPVTLFREWLDEALRVGVPEPHAMTLSTVDAEGTPDARVLILKDAGARGWAFAGARTDAKGTQLAQQASAALTFWWQPLVRSVRVRGAVVEASREDSLADLRARSAAAQATVDADDWVLWRVVPTQIEFWQGSPDRRHIRIRYVRDRGGWRIVTAGTAGEAQKG